MLRLKSIVRAIASLSLCITGAAHAGDCNPEIANNGGVASFSDLTVPGNVTACAGFYTGNANSSSSSNVALVTALLASPAWAGYGLSSTGPVEQINLTGGSGGIVNFNTPLSGLTLVGVHWGNFGGGSHPAGNVSAFYLFNAGTSLDTFTVNVTGGLSNVAIWAMQPVPEPASWGLMGLGLVGLAFRRRQRRG